MSAALALSRHGIPVHVLESAPEFTELGAGLQIGPNGTHILHGWGLGSALASVALRPETLCLKDGFTGRLLSAMPLGDAAAQHYGASYLVMARHALHRLLLEAALASPNIAISSAYRVENYTVTENHVAVIGPRGTEPLEGCALVAADGIQSWARGQLFPEVKTYLSGKTALRSVTEALFLPPSAGENAVSVWMSPDAHLVTYALGGGGPLNVVAVLADKHIPHTGKTRFDTAELKTAFRLLGPKAQTMLADCKVWTKWPLLAMQPLARWSLGRVTLLGDAAHPVLPFLASGAVMAIEDAAVLAQEVARTPHDCAGAFLRYENRRRPRLERLRIQAERMGEIYHMSGAMRLARNLALTALPARALLARNEWLYGFRV